ncbi:hypothetical protein [Pandoraea apista]|nr:hypothetical protein [Pandoraea apista]CFB61232.1 hypothetical protein LMG16407_01289 [Pandoraea apista]VVG71241.1 ribosomal protein S3AE [Pandoraea apista]
MEDPHGDRRILRLTQAEEKRLVARIESLTSYAELLRLSERMHAQLGIVLRIAPSLNEVRTVRGIAIQLEVQPGLCRKTHAAIPAAIRRCLDQRPEIAYAILDADGLFGADSQ